MFRPERKSQSSRILTGIHASGNGSGQSANPNRLEYLSRCPWRHKCSGQSANPNRLEYTPASPADTTRSGQSANPNRLEF